MIAESIIARRDGIICMDAESASIHQPCIPEIIRRFEDGYEVIQYVRTKNESAGWFKNMASSAFYKLINAPSDVKFESNASDFFSHQPDCGSRIKGKTTGKGPLFKRICPRNVGFRQTTIEYEARARVAGESKYSIRKLFQFSVNTHRLLLPISVKLGIFAGIVCSDFRDLWYWSNTLFTRMWCHPALCNDRYPECVYCGCGPVSDRWHYCEYISILFTELKTDRFILCRITRNLGKI